MTNNCFCQRFQPTRFAGTNHGDETQKTTSVGSVKSINLALKNNLRNIVSAAPKCPNILLSARFPRLSLSLFVLLRDFPFLNLYPAVWSYQISSEDLKRVENLKTKQELEAVVCIRGTE